MERYGVRPTPADWRAAVLSILAALAGERTTAEFVSTASGESPPYATSAVFGDGGFASRAGIGELSHLYSSAGVFYPTITVSDALGWAVHQWFEVNVRSAPAPLAPILAGAFVTLGLVLAVVVLARGIHRDRESRDAMALDHALRELPIDSPSDWGAPPRAP